MDVSFIPNMNIIFYSQCVRINLNLLLFIQKLYATKHRIRNQFDEIPNNQAKHTNDHANNVLIRTQWSHSYSLTTILYDQHLDNDSSNNNTQEHVIVEEPLKDIGFLLLKFPRIDFIEHLQEHEHMEEYRIMYICLGIVELLQLMAST